MKQDYLSDEEIAELRYQEDINNARWQEEEESELPVININTLEPSEATSEDLADAMIEKLLEGFINPLEFAVKKKCIENALEIVMKNEGIKNLMIDEIVKYGKDGASVLGAKLTTTERRTYDYKADPIWKEIKQRMEPLEAELREQEGFIKIATKNNKSLIDPDGTLIAMPVPAAVTTSIVCSFKKK